MSRAIRAVGALALGWCFVLAACVEDTALAVVDAALDAASDATGDALAADGQCTSLQSTEGSGSLCGSGDKGALLDTGAFVTIVGNIVPDGSEDWYAFTAQDSNSGACDTFHVTVRFTENPYSQFVFDVYRGDCPPTGQGCSDGMRYDWYTDVATVWDGGANVECPCNDAGTTGCTDDTARFYVRVRRAPGQAASCDSYTLEISNGRFKGAYP